MKVDEWFLTIAQLSVPIFCFSVGMIPQGIFTTLWIVFFGIGELVCKKITGKTLSGNVWWKKTSGGGWVARPRWVRATLSILMILGMVALGYHFTFSGPQ